MPPYWNKALPTLTLTLPDTLFSTFLLFPSILLKINAFPMWYEIWKGRKNVWQKEGSNSGWLRQNACTLPSAPLKLMLNKCLFVILTIPITLVGGVSVNSLCQQDRLFALSVNRHSVICLSQQLLQKYEDVLLIWWIEWNKSICYYVLFQIDSCMLSPDAVGNWQYITEGEFGVTFWSSSSINHFIQMILKIIFINLVTEVQGCGCLKQAENQISISFPFELHRSSAPLYQHMMALAHVLQWWLVLLSFVGSD